jgi:TonB family protein
MRRRERGSVALYMLFSLAASVGVGYVTWRTMRDARLSAEREAAANPRPVAAAEPSLPPPSEPAEPAESAEPAEPDVEAPAEEVSPSADATDPWASEGLPSFEVIERDAIDPEPVEEAEDDTFVYGTPGIAGTLSSVSMRRTVQRYNVRYARCLRKQREQRGEVERGSMRLRIDIAPDGTVQRASATLRNAEPAFGECVLEVVRKLRFDRSSDGTPTRVVYPIAFIPGQS